MQFVAYIESFACRCLGRLTCAIFWLEQFGTLKIFSNSFGFAKYVYFLGQNPNPQFLDLSTSETSCCFNFYSPLLVQVNTTD